MAAPLQRWRSAPARPGQQDDDRRADQAAALSHLGEMSGASSALGNDSDARSRCRAPLTVDCAKLRANLQSARGGSRGVTPRRHAAEKSAGKKKNPSGATAEHLRSLDPDRLAMLGGSPGPVHRLTRLRQGRHARFATQHRHGDAHRARRSHAHCRSGRRGSWFKSSGSVRIRLSAHDAMKCTRGRTLPALGTIPCREDVQVVEER